MVWHVTGHNQITTDRKFKFIIKLRLLIQRMRERSHTLWSPPPVANRSPPGWTSMEKICMPSCLTQLGFSAIIFQKFVLPPKKTFFYSVCKKFNTFFIPFPMGEWRKLRTFHQHRISSKPTRFLQKLLLLKHPFSPKTLTRDKKIQWRLACKNQAIILMG